MDAQAGCDRNGVEVLDLKRKHILLLSVHGDLEQIALFALEQDKEVAFHLVQDGSDNDDASVRVGQRSLSTRNGHSVLFDALVFVDDVVLCADEHTGGSVKVLGSR